MNFQNSNVDKYNCIICMDLCRKPISCKQCHQLICQHHVPLLMGRCPHCRLDPFVYQTEGLIQSFIEIEIRKRRETMKKENVFKCLVEGCSFEGKYQAMKYHQKSKHFEEKIDEILFPEERQKKLRRDALKNLFFRKQEERNQKLKELSLPIYVKTRGVFELQEITKLVSHIDTCKNPLCKNIIVLPFCVEIGGEKEEKFVPSDCLEGAKLKLTSKEPK